MHKQKAPEPGDLETAGIRSPGRRNAEEKWEARGWDEQQREESEAHSPLACGQRVIRTASDRRRQQSSAARPSDVAGVECSWCQLRPEERRDEQCSEGWWRASSSPVGRRPEHDRVESLARWLTVRCSPARRTCCHSAASITRISRIRGLDLGESPNCPARPPPLPLTLPSLGLPSIPSPPPPSLAHSIANFKIESSVQIIPPPALHTSFLADSLPLSKDGRLGDFSGPPQGPATCIVAPVVRVTAAIRSRSLLIVARSHFLKRPDCEPLID